MHYFLEKHSQLLLTHGREINQLASFTSIGIKSTQRAFGGVQQRHDDTCFAQAEGKVYHFPLFDGGSRAHPLLGSATSFLFHEVGQVTTFTDRFTPEVLLAATELRSIMVLCNEHVATLRREVGYVPSTLEFVTFLRDVPQLSIQVAGNMANSATSRSQLCLLYSLNNDVFQRPALSATGTDLRNKYIDSDDRRYESMSYPLFDVYGSHGWFRNNYNRGNCADAISARELNQFTDRAGNFLSLRQYIQYNFCQNDLHRVVPKLQQEWLLDQISRADSMNTPWLTKFMENRENLRTSTQRQFMRHPNPETAGHRSRIPSTVRGSQAYRREKVDMGMAHVYKFGPPTLFITITANPEWPEIKDNLKPGQQWHHDVYLVNLVFKEKLDQLISGLKRGEFFNNRKSEWIQYAIEFQKRGLPHAHILVRLEGEQPTTAAEVDALSSVHYPFQCESRCGTCRQCMLFYLVNKHMVHKCFPDRCKTRANDISGSQCKYGYPWQSNPVSFIGSDGKWVLRRRAQEHHIVEYNAELLLRFRCHINVKVTTGTRCILYLRKYMSKGPDVAHVRLANQSCGQELNNFYETRCMTAAEAAWSAVNFDYQHYDPPVRLLSLHLPGEDPVTFNEFDDPDSIVQGFKTPQIELYFARPPEHADLTFEQYFSHCDVAVRTVRRRASTIVTAINTVRFHDSNHFALYMLLKNLKPRSWMDIMGDCPSFAERAQMLGLIGTAPEDTHRAVLEEMGQRHESSDNFLRYFFFIVNDCPRAFHVLFARFWQNMIDVRSARSYTRSAALMQLRNRFIEEGCTLVDMLQDASEEIIREVEALPNIRDDELLRFFQTNVSELPLSAEQQGVFTAVTTIRHGEQRFFYINGCAGSGKTHLLRQITRKLFSDGHRVACCAPTGIAASLLPNGFTCHKLFKIPVSDEHLTNNNPQSLLNKTSRDINARLLRMATVIIIDEISMIHRDLFDLIDRVLREIMETDVPFGGKSVVFAGDFNQQAPILTNVDKEVLPFKTIDASIKSHALFQTFASFKLEHAHRFDNQRWADFLLRTIAVGNGGRVTDQQFTTHPDFAEFVREVTFARPEALDSIMRHPAFASPTPVQCIAGTHSLVKRFNDQQTAAYFDESDIVSLPSRYSYSGDIAQHLHHDQVRQIHRNNIPDDELRLAVGMPVMVMRNLNVRDGLCNGAIGTVVSIDAHSVEISLQTSRVQLRVPRIGFAITTSLIGKKSFIRWQFPLVPAFAITIAKSQGKTFGQRVIIDLRTQCFSHGSLYVALSRCTSPGNMVIITDSGEATEVENVVYSPLTV